MLTVLCVIGTRPEVIKMAPVIKRLQMRSDVFRTVVCATGQHRQMLDQILKTFTLKPDIDLNLMQNDQTLAHLTSRLLVALDKVIDDVAPDWILAQGDTTTVLVTSLLAYYHKLRFGHVEAGLRTRDIFHPFPEEVNRRFADVVATARFTPTEWARRNLIAEGCPKNSIFLTGNTVVDALHEILKLPYDWANGPLAEVPQDKRLVLITAHRRESFGRPFQNICFALKKIAQHFENDNVELVYPIHLNPNVRRPVLEILSDLTNVSIIDPLDYISLINLMRQSELVLTDSGGIQEEAPSIGVPVLIMRDTTERPEGVEAGVAQLVGTDSDRIFNQTIQLLSDPAAYAKMKKTQSLYGDGRAAERIIEILISGVPTCVSL